MHTGVDTHVVHVVQLTHPVVDGVADIEVAIGLEHRAEGEIQKALVAGRVPGEIPTSSKRRGLTNHDVRRQ